MDTIYVQYQNSGNWLTVTSLPAIDTQKMLIEMQALKRAHPDSRVRAVDQNNRVIDILT